MDERDLLVGYPPPQDPDSELLAAAVAAGRRVVVLDDDPTGTQSVTNVPVVTAWGEEDIRWALRQDTPGFYVLTNTRSLGEVPAALRNEEVLRALVAATPGEALGVTLVSRSDSTLRGHYPLETDVLATVLAANGVSVDGVVFIPAFTDAGRITIASTHWVRTPTGMVLANQTEFARDSEFGYTARTLPDYIAEKTRGRWRSEQVTRITLDRLRRDPPSSIAAVLLRLRRGRPAVVDAAVDEDLRVFSLAAIEAERQGANLLYRTGPSFVRSRLGQLRSPAISDSALRAVLDKPQHAAVAGDTSQDTVHGLIVVGSYVGLTTVQLDALRKLGGIRWLTLDVEEMRAGKIGPGSLQLLGDAVADALQSSDVVLTTSRTRVTGHDEATSRAIQTDVSATLVKLVRHAVARRRPRWLVAKGGITASDVATHALDIRRAWVRGTLLEGIVSLWEPVGHTSTRIPYVVFPGNVGDADSLSAVVARLRGEG